MKRALAVPRRVSSAAGCGLTPCLPGATAVSRMGRVRSRRAHPTLLLDQGMWHTSGARHTAAGEARRVGLDQIGGVVLFFGAGLWLACMLGGALVARRRAAAVSGWAYAEARPYGKQLQLRWRTTSRFELTV